MIDFDKYLKQPRGGQPPRPSPSPGRIDFDKYLGPQRGREPSRPVSRGTYLSGGLSVGSVFDVLRTGEYAVGGLLSRRPEETAGQATLRGIKTREESAPHFAEHFQRLGMPDSFSTDAAAFVASLVVDPINLIGFGLVPKGLRAAGAVRAAGAWERAGAAATAPIRRAVGAVAERVAPGAMQAGRIRKALEPILEEQIIRESGGIDRVIDLGKAIRGDAAKLTGNAKDARRLDQALGMYFDSGADTMLNQLATVSRLPGQGLPANVVAAARQAGLRAQQEWLRQQPEAIQQFVGRWAPRLVEEEKVFAEGLVRVGMMKPETAAKWEGIHLRKIYQRFEDPADFVKFLEQTDPARAAELLSKMERGIPLRQIGAPIPTAVTKARKLPSAERAERLGEIYQASSRYVAGGTMTERAIARGEAFQKIAQQFAPPEHIARMLSGVDEATGIALGWRKMPSTAGWGTLAEQWVPKEVHGMLIAAEKRPEGFEKVITTLVGWFKFSKVILNPATHARNIRTNISLIHNKVGLGGLRPDVMARAFREVVTNGATFREAKGVSSAFVDTFTKTEVRRFIGDLDTARTPMQILLAPFRKVASTMARAYEVEEQVGKMAVYLTARGRGASAKTAAGMAESALFNYGKVPPLVEKMRRLGFYPFITFPYKVATQTLPQVIRQPGRFAQQAKLAGLVTTEPGAEEARALPPEMRRGNYLRLPWKDARGRPLYYDITYEYVFGDIGESGTPPGQLAKMLRGEAKGLEALAPLLTPIGQMVAELVLNKSIFTGQELQRKGETFARGAGRQVARTALPGWAFATGETALAKAGLEPEPTSPLARAATGTVSRMGVEPPSLPLAAAHTFLGTRAVPVDVQAQKRSRLLELQGAIREARSEMFSVAQNPSYAKNPALRARKLAELQGRLRQYLDEYRREGTIKRTR